VVVLYFIVSAIVLRYMKKNKNRRMLPALLAGCFAPCLAPPLGTAPRLFLSRGTRPVQPHFICLAQLQAPFLLLSSRAAVSPSWQKFRAFAYPSLAGSFGKFCAIVVLHVVFPCLVAGSLQSLSIVCFQDNGHDSAVVRFRVVVFTGVAAVALGSLLKKGKGFDAKAVF
jgi:uncharacterized membrane protein YwzB